MNYQRNEIIAAQLIKDGVFEVDSDGQIWRLKKLACVKGGARGEKTYAPCRERAEIECKGYLLIRVRVRVNKFVTAIAHRVVWQYFKGEIPEGMTINHKNGVKSDNRPSNLELATMADQNHHAYHVLGVGGGHTEYGQNNANAILTNDQAREIYRRVRAGERIDDLAAEFDVNRRTVSAIKNRRSWIRAIAELEATDK